VEKKIIYASARNRTPIPRQARNLVTILTDLPQSTSCLLKTHSILSSCMRLYLAIGFFPSGFPTKILHSFSFPYACYMLLGRPAHYLTNFWYTKDTVRSTSRDSSVSITTGYGLDGRRSILGKGEIFLFSTASRAAQGSAQPPIQWVSGAVSPGVKRPGREADNSPPSSADVKNCGAIPPLHHTHSWHSVYLIKHINKFTFFHLFTGRNRIKCHIFSLIKVCRPTNRNSIQQICQHMCGLLTGIGK
jgi:hypothetical protein